MYYLIVTFDRHWYMDRRMTDNQSDGLVNGFGKPVLQFLNCMLTRVYLTSQIQYRCMPLPDHRLYKKIVQTLHVHVQDKSMMQASRMWPDLFTGMPVLPCKFSVCFTGRISLFACLGVWIQIFKFQQYKLEPLAYRVSTLTTQG